MVRLRTPPHARHGRGAIVHGFRLAERGLTPVGTPGREQWSECLDYLMHLERHIHFWIGDLLVHGEKRWGEMYDEMLQRTGYEPRTLRTLKWVASSVDVSRRREGLSFAHHQEAAGLSPEQQDLVLAQAQREGWTREMVRHAVNRLAYEGERPDVTVVSGLHHGDCRQVMQTLPDESIDLLVTDPPQGGADDVAVLDSAFACATTKLKPNSHVYIFTTWQMYPEITAVVERYFDVRNTLTWVKDSASTAGGTGNYSDRYAVILFAHKGRRHLNGHRAGDVLRFDPMALLQYLIGKSTRAKETVLDPFMRVGNTCLAAHAESRRYMGIEKDEGVYRRAVHALAAQA